MPIWVGGNSAAAYRRTAEHGHAFHAAFEPIETVIEEWRDIGAACDAVGRNRDELTLSVRMYLDPDGRMDPDVSVQGSTDRMADTIGRWGDIGVSHILLDVVAGGGSDGRLDALRGFMADVVGT